MKKAIALILVLMFCLSICACGENDKNEKENDISQSSNDTIEFDEPVLVWEDDNIRIELICFYQEYFNWADKEPAVEKGITVRYVNKTEYELIVQLEEAYLGMDAVQIIHGNGSETPAPGKATNRNYVIQNVVGAGTSALESMEDLYQLDGKFMVGIKRDGNMIDERYDVQFSFPALMNVDADA